MSGLSGEDRARLEGLLDYLQRTEDHPQAKADVDVFARALALIDQQEARVERLEHLLQHEIKVREDIAASQQAALRREAGRQPVAKPDAGAEGLITPPARASDQQEKALEAADELARVAKYECDHDPGNTVDWNAILQLLDAYRSARATSTKEETNNGD